MLKIRTGYSFRNAVGKLEETLSRLQEIGATDAPISDRSSTFGFYRWNNLAEKAGLRPVFGIKLAVTESINAKKPVVDYWTFFAQDSVEAVNKLLEMATMQFRYQPLLTYDQARSAEGVYKITGNRPLLGLLEPEDNLFLALGPSTPRGLVRKALEMGLEIAATSDNVYPREGDRGFYEVLCGRNASTQSYPQHILSEEEWRKSIAYHELDECVIRRSLDVSKAVLEGSRAVLLKAELPKIDSPKSLRQMCLEGAEKLDCDLHRTEYAERLDRELQLIADKGYEDYFFIVADIVQWARDRMVVGPARGSSCGSLVCYLLQITTIDPIPFGLIFERFVDINRTDMPDIDIDFSDQQRHQVFSYISQKYGPEYSARLGTVAMFQPRSALSEVGTALRIPKWKCDAVAESLIERSSGDSRALNTLEDTLRGLPAGQRLMDEFPEASVMTRFEGHPRHYSQHAAGVVIASRPIREYVAVDHRTNATMCDKKDAEDGYNLLKIDALGLTQLSVFEDCLAMAGLPWSTLENIPLNDPEAFRILNERRWSGIFQFNGIALQQTTQEFTVSEFNDIVSVTALARPGPLAPGGTKEWTARRNGSVPVTYPHPIFEPYLSDTLGVVIYQEQVMEIGRNVGGLDWGQVTALRKAMSKSLGAEFFDQFGDPWKRGAIEKGVDPKVVNKIWDDLCAYGSWSFNKSHSVAYGLISYWCLWLKAHYPFEFAAATLSHEKDPARQLMLLREMAAEGYEYLPVDANLSERKWTAAERDGKKFLVGPLNNVKGIGPKLESQILGARNRGEPMPARASKLLANPVTSIDTLWPIREAFEKLMPDPAERNILTRPTNIVDIDKGLESNEFLLFCTPTKINPRDENEAVKIAKRGYAIKDGPTASLNMHLTDDTGTIFGKISRFDYTRLAVSIVDRGRPGKALYAMKGTLFGGSDFRGLSIKAIKYIGDLDDA